MTISDSTPGGSSIADFPITQTLERLIREHPCSCRRLYRVITCDWAKAAHVYAIGCSACAELVAEGNTLDEVEIDFRQHCAAQDTIPF
jgi:hypothetical protein